MELLWVMYRLCREGGPREQLSGMVISKSASASGYFRATHTRLVSVARKFLGSAEPGLSKLLQKYLYSHSIYT